MQQNNFSVDYILDFARSSSSELRPELTVDLAIAVLVQEDLHIELESLKVVDFPEENEPILEMMRALSNEDKLQLILRSNEKGRGDLLYNPTLALSDPLYDFFLEIPKAYDSVIFSFGLNLLLAVETAVRDPKKFVIF